MNSTPDEAMAVILSAAYRIIEINSGEPGCWDRTIAEELAKDILAALNALGVK